MSTCAWSLTFLVFCLGFVYGVSIGKRLAARLYQKVHPLRREDDE